MRTYELMTIHRPELAEEDVRKETAGLEAFLNGAGASVSDTDFWGKRRFAYEIDHIREGYYSVLTFNGESGVVETLDRALALSDPVIRHKFVRLEHLENVSQALGTMDGGQTTEESE